MKCKILILQNNIEENIDYLIQEYHPTYDILRDLMRLRTDYVDNSFILQWWSEHEDIINHINKLLKKIEKNENFINRRRYTT